VCNPIRSCGRQLVREVYMDDRIKDYVLNLVDDAPPSDRGLKEPEPLIRLALQPRPESIS